jgi:hypothetical protein
VPPWYLDACALINLFASGQFENIVRTLGLELRVVPLVFTGEALEVYTRNDQGERGPRELMNLEPLIEAGLLAVDSEPSKSEEAAFLAYAALPAMDDGEAMTIAVAETRGGGVVTDDLPAWRALEQYAPNVPHTTTLALVRKWAETSGVDQSMIRDVLLEIEFRGRYRPSQKWPESEYAWWLSIVGKNGQ